MLRIVLLAVFIVFPLLEIALLIKLGSIFGFWPTFGLVIATAIAGTTILHQQGFAVLARSQEAMAQGQPPIEPVVDGVFLLISGLLLITPGLITDSIGVLLLVPPIRKAIARWSLRKVLNTGQHSRGDSKPNREHEWRNADPARPASARQGEPRRPSPASDAPIIEGEFERVDETTGPPKPGRKPHSP